MPGVLTTGLGSSGVSPELRSHQREDRLELPVFGGLFSQTEARKRTWSTRNAHQTRKAERNQAGRIPEVTPQPPGIAPLFPTTSVVPPSASCSIYALL